MPRFDDGSLAPMSKADQRQQSARWHKKKRNTQNRASPLAFCPFSLKIAQREAEPLGRPNKCYTKIHRYHTRVSDPPFPPCVFGLDEAQSNLARKKILPRAARRGEKHSHETKRSPDTGNQKCPRKKKRKTIRQHGSGPGRTFDSIRTTDGFESDISRNTASPAA